MHEVVKITCLLLLPFYFYKNKHSLRVFLFYFYFFHWNNIGIRIIYIFILVLCIWYLHVFVLYSHIMTLSLTFHRQVLVTLHFALLLLRGSKWAGNPLGTPGTASRPEPRSCGPTACLGLCMSCVPGTYKPRHDTYNFFFFWNITVYICHFTCNFNFYNLWSYNNLGLLGSLQW